MKIILINGSSTPLYEQIKNAIKENIVGNTVASDAQLPSVRQLSKELGVSILTVKKAYDELEREGFIVIRQGLGTFVATMNQDILKDEKQKDIEAHLLEACKIAKTINLSKSELTELFNYIYEEGIENEIYSKYGYSVTSEGYPGSPRYPLSIQKEILDKMENVKSIEVNEYFQLNPVKSVALRLSLSKKKSSITPAENVK